MNKIEFFSRVFLIIMILVPFLFFPITIYSTQIILNTTNSEEKKVAAFYYQWYGNTTDYSSTSPFNITDRDTWWHWNDKGYKNWEPPVNACSPFTPVWGWYDSADPQLIETHLRQAEWAGIDAFVSSYWGKNGLEFSHLKTMIEVGKAIKSNITISPYFEIFMGGMENLKKPEQIALLYNEFSFLYDFMTNPVYKDMIWFEDGKPVLWIYVVRLVSEDVWGAVLTDLNDAGKEFFLVADRPRNNATHIQQFQAQHMYDVYAPIRDHNYFQTFWNIKAQTTKFNQIFIAGVAPGYNDTVVRAGNAPFAREEGKYYENRWNDALSLNPDWISITSWNEWHEGTEIEPSIENGDLALNQTRDFIQQFKSGEFSTLNPQSAISVYYKLNQNGIFIMIGVVVFLGVSAFLLKRKLR